MLDTLYEETISKITFHPRKCTIEEHFVKLWLQGAKGVGKTFLLYDYISTLTKRDYLYINLEDIRLDYALLEQTLQSFITTKRIDVLILDNFAQQISLPHVNRLLVASALQAPAGFKTLKLYGLDFEEYIAMQRKIQTPEIEFNKFINLGTLPTTPHLRSYERVEFLQNYYRAKLRDNEWLIFKELTNFMGKALSKHQLYQHLKQKMKISKDTLYRLLHHFEQEGYCIFLEEYQSKKDSKYLYFYDFSLPLLFNYKKDFIGRFKNAIFLELRAKYSEVYSYQRIDFYIPKELLVVIATPFIAHEDMIRLMNSISSSLKSLSVARIEFISVSNSFSVNAEGIEIQPFYEWALMQ